MRRPAGFVCPSVLVALCCILSALVIADDLEKGVDLFQKGRFDEAKAYVEKYLASHPDHPEALFYLGTLETDGATSQKYFRSLWNTSPNHPLADDALFAICQHLFATGFYVTAGNMYCDHVMTYPESEYADDAAYWSGVCYLVAERPDSALAVWRTVISKYPESELRDWAVLGIGDALFATKDYEGAVSEYTRILQPSSEQTLRSSALYRLGRCYEYLGQSGTAREYGQRILKDHPRSFEGAVLASQQAQTSQALQPTDHIFTVQVGAFAHKENAIRLHDTLNQKGYHVEVVSKYSDSGKLLHAVQIGTYRLKEDAQVVVERLEREEHLTPRIVSKSDR